MIVQQQYEQHFANIFKCVHIVDDNNDYVDDCNDDDDNDDDDYDAHWFGCVRVQIHLHSIYMWFVISRIRLMVGICNALTIAEHIGSYFLCTSFGVCIEYGTRKLHTSI